MPFEVHPASAERFDDVALVLGGKNPTSSVCWCLSHRVDARTNRELVVAASLAARAAASNRSMKISAIMAVPSMVRSTRLDGRAELSVQVVPGEHNRALISL